MLKLTIYILFALLFCFACSQDKVENEDGNGGSGSAIAFDKTDIILPADGGTATFVVTAGKSWTLQGMKSWCQVSPVTGEAGQTTVTVTVTGDPTLYTDRNTTLSAGTSNLTVTQKKIDALTLSLDKYTIAPKGDTITVEVKHSVELDVVLSEKDAKWISRTPSSKALSTSKLQFIIAENDATEVRTGEIILKDKASNLADTILVYQAANTVLALVNDLMIIQNTGGDFFVDLRSNLTYDVEIPAVHNWIQKAPESKAIRDDRVYFTADPLTGDDNREALIIFKAKGVNMSDTLGLCQTADGSLLLMKSVFHFGPQSDTVAVKIKQTPFTTQILEGEVWVERRAFLPTRSAFRKDSVQLLIRLNPTALNRSARIVFTETPTGITDTLKITQDASVVQPIISGNRLAVASYNPSGKKTVLVSWRLLPTDPKDVGFDIYRSVNGAEEILLNPDKAITTSSCYLDATADVSKLNTYRIVQTGTTTTLATCEMTPALAANFYRSIPLNMNVPDPSLSYLPGDAAVGDLDGDGEYEIVVKREVNPTDNEKGLQSGTMLLEAYRLDGSFMWRMNMGRNIRQGAHYTPFIVYDFDGDGRDEIAIRTSEGTQFGDGYTIGDINEDGKTDYVNKNASSSTYGMVLEGPEFLSVIDGSSGTELARTDYIPRGDKSTWSAYWGDDWGNRIDRFLMGVGNFGGSRPGILICRGYYHNFQVWALDFQGGQLYSRWKFNTDPTYPEYRGQGNHNLSIGDVDNDGYDEIIYGACAIDHNGRGMYSTGRGHGDALHLGDFDPNRPGLEVLTCHEDPNQYGNAGTEFRDAASGKLIFGLPGGPKVDVGRCLVADIDPDSPGCEIWSSASGGLYSCTGKLLSSKLPQSTKDADSYNMAIWWSGSLNRQLLDRNVIQSYKDGRLLTIYDYHTVFNNGTKSNPCFYGDIWGDWREEVICAGDDGRSLKIFTTEHATDYRFPYLMSDHIYKLSATLQNIGYNQPTHTGYYIGSDLIQK